MKVKVFLFLRNHFIGTGSEHYMSGHSLRKPGSDGRGQPVCRIESGPRVGPVHHRLVGPQPPIKPIYGFFFGPVHTILWWTLLRASTNQSVGPNFFDAPSIECWAQSVSWIAPVRAVGRNFVGSFQQTIQPAVPVDFIDLPCRSRSRVKLMTQPPWLRNMGALASMDQSENMCVNRTVRVCPLKCSEGMMGNHFVEVGAAFGYMLE